MSRIAFAWISDRRNFFWSCTAARSREGAALMVFTTQPSSLSATSSSALDFSTDPVVEARDAAGIKHRTHREEASEPFQLMISMARYHDLMIFGLRSIFEYGMATEDPRDTLVRLVSAGVRPIIAVSEHYRPKQIFGTLKRFIQFCPWPNVEIKIMTFKPSEDVARQLLQDASEYCRAHGFTVETEDNPGIPKDLLFVAASLWGADLLVIGNSARNLLLKRILGETALDVIQNADRPLFLCQ